MWHFTLGPWPLVRIQDIVSVDIAKSIHRFIRLTCLSVNLELAIFVKARNTEVTKYVLTMCPIENSQFTRGLCILVLNFLTILAI